MSKRKSTFLILPFLLAGCSTDKIPSSAPSSEMEGSTVELFPDNKFERGFNALPGNKSFLDGTYPENDWTDNVYLKYKDESPNPSWQLQQTGCIYDLNDVYNPLTGTEPAYEDGYYKYTGVSNYVHVNPDIGEIVLGLEASKEYEHPRQAKENWPHLLLQNSLTETLSISELSSLDFTIDLTLKAENKMDEKDYNPSLHTAQFLMYFVVTSNSSADAGDYFWFGVPFYDYRYPKAIKETAIIDNGTSGNTGKAIYQMGNASMDPTGFKLNHPYKISINLIEKFGDALLAAQKLGRLTGTTINDLSVQSMNIGFELPGTFDVEARFSNFSLKATKGEHQ